ncbi:FadR/GntR family transcriptional regulator [Mariniluteicoccus flavus]
MARQLTSAATEDRIKAYMLEKRLRPGDPIPTESELREQLGVSRSSVREAVRTLAALDIVEVRHGHGTFVGNLSLAPLVDGLSFRGILSPGDDHSALREVVEVRSALDLGLAESICGAMTGTTNDDLRELVTRMVELSDNGEDFTEVDRRFHAALLSRVPNSLLGELVDALWEVHTTVLPHVGIATPDDIRDTVVAHGDMVDAAEAGDVGAYRAAVEQHYAPLRHVLQSNRD